MSRQGTCAAHASVRSCLTATQAGPVLTGSHYQGLSLHAIFIRTAVSPGASPIHAFLCVAKRPALTSASLRWTTESALDFQHGVNHTNVILRSVLKLQGAGAYMQIGPYRDIAWRCLQPIAKAIYGLELLFIQLLLQEIVCAVPLTKGCILSNSTNKGITERALLRQHSHSRDTIHVGLQNWCIHYCLVRAGVTDTEAEGLSVG